MITESFILMISFFIFCVLVAKPVARHIRQVLEERILSVKNRIDYFELEKENAFKNLKKAKRSLLNAKKEADDHLKNFIANIENTFRKNYGDIVLSFEKKHNQGIKFLQTQRSQKVLELYENLLDKSSYYAREYILKNRSKLPSDIEIAHELLKNISK